MAKFRPSQKIKQIVKSEIRKFDFKSIIKF